MTTTTSDGGAGSGPPLLLRITSAIGTALWVARITVLALLPRRGQR